MLPKRRQFLRLCGVAGIGAIAGCSSGSQEDEPPTSDQATSTQTGGQESTETSTDTEANATQLAKLVADDGTDDDYFGGAVAISDDANTAIIGAGNDDNPNGRNAGSAYVFDNSGGSWTQQSKLTANNGDSYEAFGVSVAVSSDGSTALISAEGRSESAYIFENTDGNWSQSAKLFPNDQSSGTGFGTSVTISDNGSIVLIGAPSDDNSNGDRAGSTYVFENTGNSWSQQAKLTVNAGDSYELFGSSVAVSGDSSTTLIGAPQTRPASGDENYVQNASSVYVFENTDGSWGQQAELTADDGGEENEFGACVAIGGNTALVGAHYTDNDYEGSAYIFKYTGGSWSQQAQITVDDGDSRDYFGISGAVSGDGSTILIGASREEEPNGPWGGAVYMFEETSGSWSQQNKLSADDGDRSDLFGSSVAMSSDATTALIGARQDEDPNGEYAGSAYVFNL
jgi:hypothetical protein